MQILSVNVGASRAVTIKHQTVQTGIYKMPVSGPVPVTRFGLQDDVRAEPRKMGLENHAVYVYPYEHYAYWQHELNREPFPMGMFGENLTVTGLLEDEVRIGDILRFGSTVLQVTQPRIPCAKLNERFGMHFSSMFLASRKVGFYLRVLQEGSIAQGDAIELLESDVNSPTLEEFLRVSHYEFWDAEALQHLLQARDLMPAWREIIEAKLERARTDTGWPGLREFELVQREQECDDTVSLYLKCARGRPLPPFRGGQLITVVLGQRSSHQHRRAYALSGNPRETSTYRITVRRIPAREDTLPEGVVSSHLVGMKVGEHILCTAPSGKLMQTQETGYGSRIPILISQGLGIAPTLSLLYEFEARQVREVYLFHEQNTHEPQGLLREVHVLMERNPGYKMLEVAPGVSGQIDAELVRLQVPLDKAEVHLAGSRSFTDRLADALKVAGLPSSALKMQSFN